MNVDKLPILIANSFPKSGTHLLTQILKGFTKLGPFIDSGFEAIRTFEGESGKLRKISDLESELNQLSAGDIAYGHVHAYPEMVRKLNGEGIAHFFIYRDPRDVVVSHVHYVTDINSKHVHHNYYVNELMKFEDRLETSIRGRPDAENPFPNIRGRFEPYIDWLDNRGVLTIRFEELISNREKIIEGILEHAIQRGFAFDGDRQGAIGVLEAGVDARNSPTFRSGKSGVWKESFSPAHKKLFKELSGDLLMRLGYEKDQNW
jgi:hypothetical protein